MSTVTIKINNDVTSASDSVEYTAASSSEMTCNNLKCQFKIVNILFESSKNSFVQQV